MRRAFIAFLLVFAAVLSFVMPVVVATKAAGHKVNFATQFCRPKVANTLRRYVNFMATQDDLVNSLVSHGWLKKPHCIEAFRRVDRKNYIDSTVPASLAYLDRPLPNGPFETISAPHMHATALELLGDRLHPGARVLDVGSGSGFLSSCFAYACKSDAYVLGIEKHADLVRSSIENIRKADGALLDSKQVEIRCGNALGAPAPLVHARTVSWRSSRQRACNEVDSAGLKFDAIHVGAAARMMPKNLCEMLKPDGLMMVPVGAQGETQVLTLVRRTKDGSDFDVKEVMHVQYVPLTPPE